MHWKGGRFVTDINTVRAAFVDGLTEPGRDLDPGWCAAFRDVPRHVFVPYFFTPRTDRPGWDIVEPPDRQWLASVWSNKPLITQLNGDDTLADEVRRGEAVDGVSTSSSSAPSLMALMLQALDVHDDQHVVEVGTGTGYNAAVLSHRLGPDHVTSIDVDPGIVERARARLATLGYAAHLVAANGLAGCPERQPFDRIIATVAIPRLPVAWIDQVGDEAKILFPLDRRNSGGIMALLTVHGATAEGHFLPDYGGFMPVRQDRHDAALTAFWEIQDHEGTQRVTTVPHEIITDEGHPFEFFAALMTGGYDSMSFTPNNGGPTQTWLAQGNGSWVCHTTDPDGTLHVRQDGPQRLWDIIERVKALWDGLGQPRRERFGLTATADHHIVWLDSPAEGEHWALPPVG